MSITAVEPVTVEQLHHYIAEAAKAAGYEKGFGVPGCDLTQPWWAAYSRQSLDQQASNNRLPEYLLTLAKMARDQGVVVPQEYVFYDHETGEHLDRPGMAFLRRELAHKKRILGILFADLRCLSREPAPQQVFERECEILGVRLLFGDAPSGMDPGSQFARSAITFSNKLARLATHSNARAGNIGRILKGMVPAQRAGFGYRYRREAEIGPNGRTIVKKAWWEVDTLDEKGLPVEGSPAWVVARIFQWLGAEERTMWWVAAELNRLGVKAPSGARWTMGKIAHILHRRCYIGRPFYNVNSQVPNPNRPLGDVTGQVRRTLLRPKPQTEWVGFSVPPLVPEPLWQRANEVVTARGRGRGHAGRVIQALMRGRLFCPRCGRAMCLQRDGKNHQVYYHCYRYYHTYDGGQCQFRRFLSAAHYDEMAWELVRALLDDQAWMDQQIGVEQERRKGDARLIEHHERRITGIKARVARVQEGFEAGVYTAEQARERIGSIQAELARAEKELGGARRRASSPEAILNMELLKRELRQLAERNLDNATFEEKLNLVHRLGIRFYPSEDLGALHVKCNLEAEGNHGVAVADANTHGKVTCVPPRVTIGRTCSSPSRQAVFP